MTLEGTPALRYACCLPRLQMCTHVVAIHSLPLSPSPSMNEPGEVEQLRPVVDLRPEPVLEPLLRLLLLPRVAERVKVSQHAHDLGETVRLQHVEELKRLLVGGGVAWGGERGGG